MRPTITLLTDFGLRDPFVGQMKGVICSVQEDVNIVDITHGITPHSIREAAVVLRMSYDNFPPKTVHVCVVDPGVGSERRPIVIENEKYFFVGPDNGVFSAVYQSSESFEVFHITSEHYVHKKVSTTFHGRDIFAPVAAWITRGIPLERFGDKIDDYVQIDILSPSKAKEGTIEGEVLYIDHFGNAMTNIRLKDIMEIANAVQLQKARILCKGREITLKNYYADACENDLFAIINSNGLLELFVYHDNAAKKCDLHIGDRVEVVL